VKKSVFKNVLKKIKTPKKIFKKKFLKMFFLGGGGGGGKQSEL